MTALVETIRWFNHVLPWHQPKPALAAWADDYIDKLQGEQIYTGVAGQLRMRLDLGCIMQRWIYLGVYDPVTVGLLRRLLRPGDVYVDVGANLGLFVLIAARQVGAAGRVVAFEPNPEIVIRLQENIALNALPNVTVVPKACWHCSGAASLFGFADGNVGEASMGQRSDKQVGREFTIETVRLDDVVTGPVRMLKLDVEGAEAGALAGAERLFRSRQPPHLLLELNPVTASAFGYHPLALVERVLDWSPGYRLHLLKSKRSIATDRDRLEKMFAAAPAKMRNVWFEPGAEK